MSDIVERAERLLAGITPGPWERRIGPVTCRVNILRGDGVAAINARKTACKRGHEFTPENTYMNGGRRVCRTCKRQRERVR